MSKPKILAIVGPTASGKTDLALRLARKFNGELIAADSRTIYKGMDIGTAKPTDGRWRKIYGERACVVKGVPTFLMDVITPDKLYAVAEFKNKAEELISKIAGAGKLPMLVGGSGLYVQALLENWQLPKVAPNLKLRRELEKKLAKGGLLKLYKQLIKLDPECAKFIDQHNPRRVLRALEVCLVTGQPFSSLRHVGEQKYRILIIGVNQPREKLYKRINKRVDLMIKAGLEKEVKKLSKKYSWKSPGMNGLGYRQFKDYFEGRASLEQTIDDIKKQTRHYAKRQMTWFRKQEKVKWVRSYLEAVRAIEKFI